MLNNQKEIILLKDLGMQYPKESSKYKKRYGIYKCYCGKEFKAQLYDVNNGKIKSCGCLRGYNHNLTNHRLYSTWQGMIKRCYDKNNINYKYYGKRNIKVCDEWRNIKTFIEDMYPSYIEGLTLDRINVNGNYEINNCRWVTKTIQARNTRLLQSNNKSGYKGVLKYRNKFRVQIVVNYKIIYLGTFKTAIEAAQTRDKYIDDNKLEHTKNFN